MWPPDLDALKADMRQRGVTLDDADDVQLTIVLDASVAFTERVHSGGYNFTDDPLIELPAPTPDLELGTVRLAARWHTRRRSPDGLISMAELGAARVPSFDPDIERLLRIGRFVPGRFA